MDSEKLKVTLRIAEGSRLKPYTDSLGKLTIGVGRNLEDVGLRPSEVDFLLQNDVTHVLMQVGTLACWHGLSEVRQRVLAEMCFQMGFGALQQFRRMFAAIEAQNFAQAADEMLDSQWAVQTPGRAHRLSQMMRLNQDIEL